MNAHKNSTARFFITTAVDQNLSMTTYKSASRYFSQGEYLVGDCAYSGCKVMAQTLKKLRRISKLCARKEFLNSKLGSSRVKSEHYIGILKNHLLRRTNANIKDQADVMKGMETFESSNRTQIIFFFIFKPIFKTHYMYRTI